MSKKKSEKQKEEQIYKAGIKKILMARKQLKLLDTHDAAKQDAEAIMETFNRELKKVSLAL